MTETAPRKGRLEGKVALITGTGGGQGRAAALLFAQEGAKVVGCDLNEEGASETEKMVRNAGGTMVSMAPVDISEEAGATRWVEDAAAAFGGVNILYNNASAARFGPFGATSIEDYKFTIRNELDIVYLVTRAAWQHLVDAGGGSIINTASAAAFRGLRFYPQSAHGAAKGGVASLASVLAIEGGPHKIRVNTITPGPIAHPFFDAALADAGHPLHDPVTSLVTSIPLGRLGKPEDVAPLALFLASDESSYITGTNVVIDGGFTTAA